MMNKYMIAYINKVDKIVDATVEAKDERDALVDFWLSHGDCVDFLEVYQIEG